MPIRVDEKFGKAVAEALDSRGLSVRAAEIKTGIDYGTILRMRNGHVPKKGVVLDWAQGMGEPINKWFELAGYAPIEPRSLGGETTAQPDVPADVLRAIEAAPTDDEKIEIAFDYLRRPELDLGIVSSGTSQYSTRARLALVRIYEKLSGKKLLPDDVI